MENVEDKDFIVVSLNMLSHDQIKCKHIGFSGKSNWKLLLRIKLKLSSEVPSVFDPRLKMMNKPKRREDTPTSTEEMKSSSLGTTEC